MKFDEFVNGQKFYDMKKLCFKAGMSYLALPLSNLISFFYICSSLGSNNDDTLLKAMLYIDLNRAMG